VFTARYALSPYIQLIRFVFKGLKIREQGDDEEVSLKIAVCCHVTPCSFVDSYQRHGGICSMLYLPWRKGHLVSPNSSCHLSKYTRTQPKSHHSTYHGEKLTSQIYLSWFKFNIDCGLRSKVRNQWPWVYLTVLCIKKQAASACRIYLADNLFGRLCTARLQFKYEHQLS
jgi:hypothetical protein